MDGNPMGAVSSLAGGIAGNMGNAAAPQVNSDSMTGALQKAAQSYYMPQGPSIWDEYKENISAPARGQVAANNAPMPFPTYQIDPTDALAREQNGKVYDAWADYGRRRRA
jgi:hypothetical protein